MFSKENYRKYILALFFGTLFFSSFAQTSSPTSTCNLQVYIDSIIVNPCFRTGGGACGCNNTLWAVVSGGTAPYQYHWTPNSQNTDSIFNVCYVEFSVKVTDANGCIAYDSLNVVLPEIVDSTSADTSTVSSGINNINKNKSSITIYPNPASDKLLINFGNSISNALMEVYNLKREKVLSQQSDLGTMYSIIDISSLAEGSYILRINNSGKLTEKKFLKEK